MDDSIWIAVIAVSVILLLITFLTSVTVLHKKFIEKPLENKKPDFKYPNPGEDSKNDDR